jgi:hypothetical protein
MKPTQLFKHCI